MYPDHDDALVISVRIASVLVKRIIVDTGSSAGVLYLDTFQKLDLTKKDLNPMASTLSGFIGDFVSPLDTTTLLVTIGEDLRSKTIKITFMVVGLPLANNVILGCPTLNKLKAAISMYHQAVKFPTRVGVRELRSDPQESRLLGSSWH
ncbi:hypothetical protein B296_00053974 [Ensete ventricosum]|uniref:Peptidase A2 domain-containing protein n=1 Tax=Ensete ventricosum TaxID=4639 RepID=A0A426X4E3_ENSVE|nr:hypothetical protein B296_00053974 [Ensete ventricosum]